MIFRTRADNASFVSRGITRLSLSGWAAAASSGGFQAGAEARLGARLRGRRQRLLRRSAGLCGAAAAAHSGRTCAQDGKCSWRGQARPSSLPSTSRWPAQDDGNCDIEPRALLLGKRIHQITLRAGRQRGHARQRRAERHVDLGLGVDRPAVGVEDRAEIALAQLEPGQNIEGSEIASRMMASTPAASARPADWQSRQRCHPACRRRKVVSTTLNGGHRAGVHLCFGGWAAAERGGGGPGLPGSTFDGRRALVASCWVAAARPPRRAWRPAPRSCAPPSCKAPRRPGGC